MVEKVWNMTVYDIYTFCFFLFLCICVTLKDVSVDLIIPELRSPIVFLLAVTITGEVLL